MQGVVGGVASVMMHLQLSYLSVPGRAFRMLATKEQIAGIVYQKYGGFLRIFFHVLLHNFIFIPLETRVRVIPSKESF